MGHSLQGGMESKLVPYQRDFKKLNPEYPILLQSSNPLLNLVFGVHLQLENHHNGYQVRFSTG